MAYSPIQDKADPLLTVYVDREEPEAQVFYSYEGGADQNTPFQTADLPMDDRRAWNMVNVWVEG